MSEFQSEIILLTIGGFIVMIGNLVATVVKHILSLRADEIKRERDKKQRQVAGGARAGEVGTAGTVRESDGERTTS